MEAHVVTVRRDGRFWFVEIPALDGATQARSLGEVDEMARDYIASVLDIPEDSFELKVGIELPEAVKAHLVAVEAARAEEAEARRRAAAEWAAAARGLRDAGLTVREIGATLKISHQRAAQLTKA